MGIQSKGHIADDTSDGIAAAVVRSGDCTHLIGWRPAVIVNATCDRRRARARMCMCAFRAFHMSRVALLSILLLHHNITCHLSVWVWCVGQH
eukprot:scaffold69741_cov37-Tisochrysis_lutea.AAC.2